MRKVVLMLMAPVLAGALAALAAPDKAAPSGAAAGKVAAPGLTPDQKAKIAEIRRNARQQVLGLLTDEQKARWQALRQRVAARVKELRPNLTDDQKAKIKGIVQGAREKAQGAQTPQEKMRILQAARQEARKVLTEEQAQKVDALKDKFGTWRDRAQKWRARQAEKESTAPAK